MASSSNVYAASYTFPNVSHLVSIKLDNGNYIRWLTQIEPVLKANELLGIVEGTELCSPIQVPASANKDEQIPNPTYSLWVKKDQSILGRINATFTEIVLSTIYGLRTSHEVWKFLAIHFAFLSSTRLAQIKRQLQMIQQGNQTFTAFVDSAQRLINELAAVGKPVDDEEFITYILNGLHPS